LNLFWNISFSQLHWMCQSETKDEEDFCQHHHFYLHQTKQKLFDRPQKKKNQIALSH